MPNINSPMTVQNALDRSSPAAADCKLGTLLVQLIAAFNGMQTRLNCQMLSSAGLAIKTGGSAIVKAGSTFAALVAGTPLRVAANTDMSALVGTLATAKSALWAFYIDAAGTVTTSTKTADANSHAAAIALLPPAPDGKTQIGFIVIDNATGSNFVGGTTALDTGSLTVTYYNTHGTAPMLGNAGTTAAAAAAQLADLESRY